MDTLMVLMSIVDIHILGWQVVVVVVMVVVVLQETQTQTLCTMF